MHTATLPTHIAATTVLAADLVSQLSIRAGELRNTASFLERLASPAPSNLPPSPTLQTAKRCRARALRLVTIASAISDFRYVTASILVDSLEPGDRDALPDLVTFFIDAD